MLWAVAAGAASRQLSTLCPRLRWEEPLFTTLCAGAEQTSGLLRQCIQTKQIRGRRQAGPHVHIFLFINTDVNA